MKVVLLAGFSSKEIRDKLVFKKDTFLYHRLIRLFGLPARVGEFSDFAPWIPLLISGIERHPEIDLYVLGPHIRLRKSIETFDMRGVHYYFFKSEWTSLCRLINSYSIWKLLQMSSRYSRRILKKINPDLVVLSGAENPTTSIPILFAKDYPRLCLCQTIYNNPDRLKYAKPNKLIQALEKDIICELPFFGVFSKMHFNLLKSINPNAQIFRYGYPSNGRLLTPVKMEKEFDFVNFALQMDFRKGFHDSIRALAIVKKFYPCVKLNLMGRVEDNVKQELVSLIEDMDLRDNVFFTPFFEKQSDALMHIQKSRFAVLPCKLDHISGTMLQCMQLKIPIVVYKTSGTPMFNRKKECALIAELGNIDDLAAKMLILMQDSTKSERLAENARDYQERQCEIEKSNGEELIDIFNAVVGFYNGNTPIPQNLFFN